MSNYNLYKLLENKNINFRIVVEDGFLILCSNNSYDVRDYYIRHVSNIARSDYYTKDYSSSDRGLNKTNIDLCKKYNGWYYTAEEVYDLIIRNRIKLSSSCLFLNNFN